MIRKFLLIIFLLGFQNIYAQTPSFGFKAGINLSTIGGDSQNLSPKMGLHGGFFSFLKLSETLKLKPELLFSDQGGKASANTNLRFSYWYLTAPIIIQYQGNSPIFIDFGLQLGSLIKAKEKEEAEHFTSQLEILDISLCLGIGYNLSNNFSLAVRYNYGLTNTTRNPDFEGLTFPNRVFQFTVAYVLIK